MEKLSIGKRNEYSIWAKLLENEIDVFPSLVDDKGIDGLVGFDGNYFEIQIKSGNNWGNQRGFTPEACSKNLKRIFIIYNYTEKKCIYLTCKQILEEKEWEGTMQYEISQLKWNKKLLEKYSPQDFNSLVKYLKTTKN